MDLKNLKSNLVAVLGYGQEGKAVTKYLMKHGVTPVLFDQRPWENWDKIEKLEVEKLGAHFIFGPDVFKELRGFDVAFRSPGIKIADLAEVLGSYDPKTDSLNYGGQKSILLTSQTKWFIEHCPAKIVGVTGTKGKGTTSALTYEMLKADRKNVYLTGNIGKTQPMEILDDLKANDWIVYELSSFQLQDLNQSPHIGVVLMVTSEHLDYHKSQNEYLEAKSAIAKFQTADDVAIINAGFENSIKIGEQGRGQRRYFSTQRTADCYVENDLIYLSGEPFIRTDELLLKGKHNWQNVCAAILASDAAGCDHQTIKKVAVEFKGLEHRLEFVAEKGGVKFYNDSFSTTPETAIAAINSFHEPLIVILGGSSKNSDFDGLGKIISGKKNIKDIILIGQEADRIKSTLDIDPRMIIEGAQNMQEIFTQISSVARKGDVVLLSSACASFDMFKNYSDRGQKFKEQVNLYADKNFS